MSRGPGGVYAIPSLVNANGFKECAECQKSFTIFRPKYHCRNCGSVVCANCSEHRNEIPKFGYQNPVRCCDSCHEMIHIQRMGTQALLQLPMKKLKYYLSAYQLPTKGALEKQDLVKIIVQSHPISNLSEIHYRNFKAKERKTTRQDTPERDSQPESGGTFSGFVNGLVDGIGDIFKDDDEPARREEEERRRRQNNQQRQESSRRQQQQQQQQQQQRQQQQQQRQQQQQQQEHWRQQQQRQWQQRQQQQYQQQQQQNQNQNTQRPQTNQSSTTSNSTQPQNRPSTATTSSPPRSSPASGSPDLVEPPSLDTLLQAKIDPSTLSVRTLKAILKTNFVEHSKVLEKSELVTRVGRLLDDRKQERQRTDDRDLEDEGLCRICCDASQNCVFLECGHMVTCMECGKKLVASRNECPICRERIVKLVHVFRS